MELRLSLGCRPGGTVVPRACYPAIVKKKMPLVTAFTQPERLAPIRSTQTSPSGVDAAATYGPVMPLGIDATRARPAIRVAVRAPRGPHHHYLRNDRRRAARAPRAVSRSARPGGAGTGASETDCDSVSATRYRVSVWSGRSRTVTPILS